MSAPPAPDFAREPCEQQIPRNCGHFWVTRSHGMTCVTCVTSPIEVFPESSWNRIAVSTREAGTQTRPEEAAEGASRVVQDSASRVVQDSAH
eukprot:6668517-Prymnesium_polylepis.1